MLRYKNIFVLATCVQAHKRKYTRVSAKTFLLQQARTSAYLVPVPSQVYINT